MLASSDDGTWTRGRVCVRLYYRNEWTRSGSRGVRSARESMQFHGTLAKDDTPP